MSMITQAVFLSPITLLRYYEFLMTDVCYRNALLISSREETRTCGVKWKTAWSNVKLTKSVTAQEKYFQWQVQQDMIL